jgi:hypothetical protein
LHLLSCPVEQLHEPLQFRVGSLYGALGLRQGLLLRRRLDQLLLHC